MIFKFLVRNRSVFLYGISLAILLLFIKWLEWRLIVIDYTIELYVGAIAVIFTGLGIWLAKKLTQPKTNTLVIEKQILVKTEHFYSNHPKV